MKKKRYTTHIAQTPPDDLLNERRIHNDNQNKRYAGNNTSKDNDNNNDMTKPNETEFNSDDI